VNGVGVQLISLPGDGAIATLQAIRNLGYVRRMNFMPARITKGLLRRMFTVAQVEGFLRKGINREHERFELKGGDHCDGAEGQLARKPETAAADFHISELSETFARQPGNHIPPVT
jgi:hypothetical protein